MVIVISICGSIVAAASVVVATGVIAAASNLAAIIVEAIVLGVGPVDAFLELSKIRHEHCSISIRQSKSDWERVSLRIVLVVIDVLILYY